MTTKTLSFKSLPSIAVSEGATTPNPGTTGVWAWSTTLSKPVYWNGTLWSSITTGSSGSSTVYSGTATIDFGNYPGSNETTVSVTGQGSILSTSGIRLFISANATSVDHTSNDHTWIMNFLNITVGDVVPSTGFTIYANSIHKLQGKYTINWTWS